MKRPWLINGTIGVLMAVGAVAWALTGFVLAAVAWTFLAAFNLGFAAHFYKESHGRHRKAEEGSRDPGAYSVTYASGGPVHPSLAYHVTYGSGTGLARLEEAPKDEVDHVQSDLPILAHRAAKLLFGGTALHFDSVTDYGKPFGVDADARCAAHDFDIYFRSPSYTRHAAPALGCTCGFYALPPDLPATYEDCTRVTLLVELSGTVIEHEKGYRAGHQRVIGCELPPCPYCGAQAEAVLVAERAMVEAVCAHHAPVPAAGQVFVKVDDLAALLPVSVTRAGRVNA